MADDVESAQQELSVPDLQRKWKQEGHLCWTLVAVARGGPSLVGSLGDV